jgi:hypothetical protein
MYGVLYSHYCYIHTLQSYRIEQIEHLEQAFKINPLRRSAYLEQFWTLPGTHEQNSWGHPSPAVEETLELERKLPITRLTRNNSRPERDANTP